MMSHGGDFNPDSIQFVSGPGIALDTRNRSYGTPRPTHASPLLGSYPGSRPLSPFRHGNRHPQTNQSSQAASGRSTSHSYAEYSPLVQYQRPDPVPQPSTPSELRGSPSPVYSFAAYPPPALSGKDYEISDQEYNSYTPEPEPKDTHHFAGSLTTPHGGDWNPAQASTSSFGNQEVLRDQHSRADSVTAHSNGESCSIRSYPNKRGIKDLSRNLATPSPHGGDFDPANAPQVTSATPRQSRPQIRPVEKLHTISTYHPPTVPAHYETSPSRPAQSPSYISQTHPRLGATYTSRKTDHVSLRSEVISPTRNHPTSPPSYPSALIAPSGLVRGYSSALSSNATSPPVVPSPRPQKQHHHSTPSSYLYQHVPETQQDTQEALEKKQPQVQTHMLNDEFVVDSGAVDEYNDQTHVRSRKRRGLRGYLHVFEKGVSFRLSEKPHFYRKPRFKYEGAERHRHKDTMLRIRKGPVDDRYVSPHDGKVKELVVQAVEDIYQGHNHASSRATWSRTFVRCACPYHLQIANWTTSHIEPGTLRPTWKQKVLYWAKVLPAALCLIFVIWIPGNAEGEVRNGGRYDPFPYRFFGYAKVARNEHEEQSPKLVKGGEVLGRDGIPPQGEKIHERLLRPRYLCFLRNPDESEMQGVDRYAVEDWIEANPDSDFEYLFVAYTSQQFKHQNPEDPDDHDMEALHRIGERAARDAGVPAFWAGGSCMPGGAEAMHHDVYRISDVIRGAKAMIIAIKQPRWGEGAMASEELLLKQWGQRIWTFPEVLLAPRGRPIKIYQEGKEDSPLSLSKNQFAARVWNDAPSSRQLIDHFEGSLILSRLELVQLGIQCIYSRDKGNYLPGDHSYALMGLLRLRPTVDRTDSSFQAFARLSLANDSDQLLERMISIHPRTPSQPWHTMADAFGASLWDIQPTCQIAGISHDDTVIIDGARAASVRWKSFATVHNERRFSWTRLLTKLALHTSSLVFAVAWMFIGVGWYIMHTEDQLIARFPATFQTSAQEIVQGAVGLVVNPTALVDVGILCLVYAIPIMLAAPKLLRIVYGGKFWNTQPWLFGFEGYMDIETIEYQIFGARLGRLTWSAFGSPLSRHRSDEYGDCEAVDPCSDPAVRALVQKARRSEVGEQKIFTLVDTARMTVTLFQAARPPVAFLLTGSEGGMQRAVGCSYDWTRGILYSETVLRMDTSVKDKMDLIPRARVGFRRPVARVVPVR